MDTTLAAQLYALLTAGTCAFQLALAAGVPWGHLAMGGKFPGRFPPAMRIAALVQLVVLAALAGIVLVRAGLVLPASQAATAGPIWFVVGVAALSTLMNLATPSRWERILWAPVTICLLVSSLIVARS